MHIQTTCVHIILSASACDACRSVDPCSSLTLEGQHLPGVDHDAELQDQLGGALQEGLQQAQHADISALKHHAPVVVAALGVSVPTALHAQIQSVYIPVCQKQDIHPLIKLKPKKGGKILQRSLGFNTVLLKLLNIITLILRSHNSLFQSLRAVRSSCQKRRVLVPQGFRLD